MIKTEEWECNLLGRYFPKEEMNRDNWEIWIAAISNVIYDQKQHSEIFLFTKNPDKKRSIGYDLGEIWREGKFGSTQYLITDLNEASFENIKLLVDTDEFYLGFVFLLLGRLSDRNIQNLVVLPENNILLTSVEFFKMDLDGCAFFWYNPSSIESAKITMKRYFG